ncbi:MAG: DNA-3-methyladenine glycosylase I [Saprospiraceae bacterium]|nr:DNA-3-methyladenine glycosylase I [Saprospiraceae bacterium]
MSKPLHRCGWCLGDPIYENYHDEVWGVPTYDDRDLFAKLILDGAQAGLSWITILKKQDNYYQAFDNFDAEKIARYSPKKIEELLQNPGIVRNKLKVNAAVTNAQAYLKILEEEGSFSDFLWKFVDGQPIVNTWKHHKEAPATSSESDALSKALKKRGFKFVGSTIVYAFMQAVGMVNDHTVSCFRYKEVQKLY